MPPPIAPCAGCPVRHPARATDSAEPEHTRSRDADGRYIGGAIARAWLVIAVQTVAKSMCIADPYNSRCALGMTCALLWWGLQLYGTCGHQMCSMTLSALEAVCRYSVSRTLPQCALVTWM